MRFTQIILAAAGAALSQAVIITNTDFSGITVGTPFTITYKSSTGPTQVFLGTGSPENLIANDLIATGGAADADVGSSVTWTPTSGGSFAFKIVDQGSANSATNPNFSGFFTVAGPVSSSSSSSSSTTTTTTSSSSTTTSSSSSSSTTPAANTTVTTSTSTKASNGTTSTSTRSGSSTGTNTPATQVPSSLAAGIASPLAFVFLALTALVTLN